LLTNSQKICLNYHFAAIGCYAAVMLLLNSWCTVSMFCLHLSLMTSH